MNKTMITKFIFLLILILIKCTISMDTVVPFLTDIPSGGKPFWGLTQKAYDKLRTFEHKTFHAVAIGGPTRAGKSFIIGHIMKRFEERGGCKHFGKFVYRHTTESVTKGMDIALVEYKGKLILLIDCEGLKSASDPMDPKLMLIMSMISQKMIYLTKNVDKYMIDDISTMIANLKQIDLVKGYKRINLPLNSMYVVLNQTELEGSERNYQFLENNLTQQNKNLFNSLFQKRQLHFITEKPKSEKDCSDRKEFNELTELFENDITTIFEKLIHDLPSFTFDGREITIGEFLQLYLNKDVLPSINSNKKICYPDMISEIYKNYARQVINNMPYFYDNIDTDIAKHCCYPDNGFDDSYIQYSMANVAISKDDFDAHTFSYREYVQDIREKYFRELDDRIEFIINKKNKDIRKQNEIIDTENVRNLEFKEWVEIKTTGILWNKKRWIKYKYTHRCRTKYIHRNGYCTYSEGNYYYTYKWEEKD